MNAETDSKSEIAEKNAAKKSYLEFVILPASKLNRKICMWICVRPGKKAVKNANFPEKTEKRM